MARAVALDPANPALLMAQAHLLNGLGRIEQAIEVLAHAGERFPRDPQIRDFRILLLSSAPGKEGRVEAISGPFRPLPRSTARPAAHRTKAAAISPIFSKRCASKRE